MIGYVSWPTTTRSVRHNLCDGLLALFEAVRVVETSKFTGGGTAPDGGPAGPRGEGFYAGHLDLDSNKLCIFVPG